MVKSSIMYKTFNVQITFSATISAIVTFWLVIRGGGGGGGGGDRVPSCRHRAGGVGQFLAGMQFSTKVLKCVVIC